MSEKKINQQRGKYPVPEILVKWLDGGLGRAAHFQRVDPILHAPVVAKIKAGRIPVTFEYACRLERAQMPSDKPFKAVEIMTFEQDRELYDFVSGKAPAPAYVPHVRAPHPRASQQSA